MTYVLLAIIFYLIGSLPGGLIIGNLFHKSDVRLEGSGNLGTTNMIRVHGKKVGWLTFVFDVFKCVIPIYLVIFLNSINFFYNQDINPFYVSIFLAIGHCYPIFADFKGGKAVSTCVGIFLTINPLASLIAIIVFFTVSYITKYVSVGSTILVLTGLTVVIVTKEPLPEIILSVLLVILTMFKHIPNYKKLIKGTENKAFIRKSR